MEWLRERRDALAAAWADEALAAYPAEGAAALARERDPFANPLGHAVRSGTAAALDALLAGLPADRLGACLEGIIRIRAVQTLPPSVALSFIPRLKAVLRAEAAAAPSPASTDEQLCRLEEAVDAMALAAVDLYVRCREQVFELRVNEARRRVAWVVDRLNARSNTEEVP